VKDFMDDPITGTEHPMAGGWKTMPDNRQNTNSFKCECGKTFKSESEYREHQKTHAEKGRAAHAGAVSQQTGPSQQGGGSRQSGRSQQTGTGRRGDDAGREDNQQGREESQQGWRNPNQPTGRETQVTDEHEWKHGKQEDDKDNKMADDWGKSDKH
jgi:hypothetical protein